MLLSSFITACNGNLDKFTISRSTTRRNRNAIRHGISLEILETYRESPPKFAALHWDGKLTKDRLGEVYDALSVIASGAPKYVKGKLLGVQRIKNATGKAQAEATFELIELWSLKQNITSLVLDTTASNSVWKSGAPKILEEKLERKVFYLACRHHVYELVIGAVWKRLFGKSTGPETPLFNQFKTAWKTLDKSQPTSTVTISDPWLLERKSVVIDELEEVLRFPGKDSKRVFPRADYRECTENTLTVLAHDPPQGRRNHKPGATHSARWMGQMLYAQKMFLWSDQMQCEATVLDQLHRLNVFIAIFYTSAWMKTSFGADAPVNDLNFIKDMIRFQQIDEDIGKAAFNAIYKHRWYITEELVVFSLFSSIATEDLKRKMADKLLSLETGESFRLGRPPFQCISAETNLEDLIGSESLYLFTTLGITTERLGLPVSHWVDNDECVVAPEFVHSVKVINDAAERGVKLSTECSAIITDDPEQRRWLLFTQTLRKLHYRRNSKMNNH